ncbi:MAG: GNAT family N-acetyltransferase [Actinomycetota bacterium]|nr:GNAT family N-acetyltransferase [Actinomycetota bacterium]
MARSTSGTRIEYKLLRVMLAGLMTAGLRAVLNMASGELELHRLEANIQPANVASIALVQRLGFERGPICPVPMVGGDWRDHERWALRSEQWPG